MYRRPACNDAVPCAVAVLLIALVLAGCGGDDEPTGDIGAGEFLQRITADHLNGDFSESWEDLHPAHQKLITQIQFVYCGEREPPLEEDTTVRVLSVKPVTKDLPDIPQHRAEAVRIQLRDKNGRRRHVHGARRPGGRRMEMGPVAPVRAGRRVGQVPRRIAAALAAGALTADPEGTTVESRDGGASAR